MKKIFCLLIPLSLPFFTPAQSAGQEELYVYQRTSTPGTLMQVTDEKTGKEIPREAPRIINWFIYLATEGTEPPPASSCLWIDGKAYELTAEKVQSPVILDREGLGSQTIHDTLVPALGRTVWRLQPGKEIPAARKTTKADVAEGYVSLEWKKKGGRKKMLKAEIKKLPPLILQ